MLLLETLNESTTEPEGAQYYLSVGTYSVGRDEGCAIRLTEDRSISRVHAQIVVHPHSEEGWLADVSGTEPYEQTLVTLLLPRLSSLAHSLTEFQTRAATGAQSFFKTQRQLLQRLNCSRNCLDKSRPPVK